MNDQILVISGLFILLSIPFLLLGIERKLDRIVNLLDIANQQRGLANFSLRSMEHDATVIRERTPVARDDWEDDLIANRPDRP